MTIVMVHNFYQQAGGEDQVFAAEADLLASRGHRVIRFTVHNDAIQAMGRCEAAARTVWNAQTIGPLRDLLRLHRPDLVHFHNTFPLISPAAHHAVHGAGVPVVQTLHNFRLLCPVATFFRAGRACEECMGKAVAYPALRHGCYRQSRAASAAVVAMLTAHRLMRTWQKTVDLFIALSQFSRRKLIQGGLPAQRIVVKPNFVSAPARRGEGRGGYAICVGRLSPEKGVDVLLDAWRSLGDVMPLKIVGDGPLADQVRQAAQTQPSIQWLGRLPSEQVQSLMADASVVVLPSACYENFPRVIVEAYAAGTPVVASRLGAMAELVEDGRTGLLFEPGNAADLARTVASFVGDAARQSAMRDNARRRYEEAYTPEKNHALLMGLYEQAIRHCAAGRVGRRPSGPATTERAAADAAARR